MRMSAKCESKAHPSFGDFNSCSLLCLRMAIIHCHVIRKDFAMCIILNCPALHPCLMISNFSLAVSIPWMIWCSQTDNAIVICIVSKLLNCFQNFKDLQTLAWKFADTLQKIMGAKFKIKHGALLYKKIWCIYKPHSWI